MTTTARKRYRIKSKARFTCFITVVILLTVFAISGFLGMDNAAGLDQRSYITINVESGDTLWDIAMEYAPNDMDCRQYIYEIGELNNVSANTLQAGQTLSIPIYM